MNLTNLRSMICSSDAFAGYRVPQGRLINRRETGIFDTKGEFTW